MSDDDLISNNDNLGAILAHDESPAGNSNALVVYAPANIVEERRHP